MANRRIDVDGWQIEAVGDWLARRPQLAQTAAIQTVHTVESGAGLFHRSRHASTYLTQISDVDGKAAEVYVKIYKPPRGTSALKEAMRGGRAGNVVRMTAALNRAGFFTPALLLTGLHPASKRTMVASTRAAGVPLPDLLAQMHGDGSLLRKRMLLRSLGIEAARLHRTGFIHGDLTPYNSFVVQSEPPRFIFLDHDRTRRPFPAGRFYRRLRNLVQLGRFDLDGISNTDRLRVFRAYAGAMGQAQSRRTARLLAWMLARRRRRDAS
jgi:tRNA A-37 threonylcarbamoyl transferase component Bud32